MMKRLPLIVALGLLLAGCGQDKHNTWLGYAEGDYAFISAPLSGWVTSVAVNRGDWVKNGEPLFALDDAQHAKFVMALDKHAAPNAKLKRLMASKPQWEK